MSVLTLFSSNARTCTLFFPSSFFIRAEQQKKKARQSSVHSFCESLDNCYNCYNRKLKDTRYGHTLNRTLAVGLDTFPFPAPHIAALLFTWMNIFTFLYPSPSFLFFYNLSKLSFPCDALYLGMTKKYLRGTYPMDLVSLQNCWLRVSV